MGKTVVKYKPEKVIQIDIKFNPPIGWVNNSKMRSRYIKFRNLLDTFGKTYYYNKSMLYCSIKNIKINILEKDLPIKKIKQIQKAFESKEAKDIGIKSFRIRNLSKRNMIEYNYENIYSSKNWGKKIKK